MTNEASRSLDKLAKQLEPLLSERTEIEILKRRVLTLETYVGALVQSMNDIDAILCFEGKLKAQTDLHDRIRDLVS